MVLKSTTNKTLSTCMPINMTSEPLVSQQPSSDWKGQLKAGARLLSIELPEKSLALFERYMQELVAWNARINITALKTPDEIMIKHFLDSLSILAFMPEKGCVADVGSGGGFPGIPIKIARPALQLTLIEAARKKANFLRHIMRSLTLEAVEIWAARVEHLPEEKQFDCVVSRAFADLKKYLQVAAPLAKEQGTVVAMKGRNIASELRAAEESLKKNGLVIAQKRSFLLPYNGGARNIVVFKKCFT
jgi:16S rRNA (guanine527-N7)-methyltransferase